MNCCPPSETDVATISENGAAVSFCRIPADLFTNPPSRIHDIYITCDFNKFLCIEHRGSVIVFGKLMAYNFSDDFLAVVLSPKDESIAKTRGFLTSSEYEKMFPYTSIACSADILPQITGDNIIPNQKLMNIIMKMLPTPAVPTHATDPTLIAERAFCRAQIEALDRLTQHVASLTATINKLSDIISANQK